MNATTDDETTGNEGSEAQTVIPDGARVSSGPKPRNLGGAPRGNRNGARKPKPELHAVEDAELPPPWSNELFTLEGAAPDKLRHWSEQESLYGPPVAFTLKRWSERAGRWASVVGALGKHEIADYPDEQAFAETFGAGRFRCDLFRGREGEDGARLLDSHRVCVILIEDDDEEEEEETTAPGGEEPTAPPAIAPPPPPPVPVWDASSRQWVLPAQVQAPPPPPVPVWDASSRQWVLPTQAMPLDAAGSMQHVLAKIANDQVAASARAREDERANARMALEAQAQTFKTLMEMQAQMFRSATPQPAAAPAAAAATSPLGSLASLVGEVAELWPQIQPFIEKFGGGAKEGAIQAIGGQLLETIGEVTQKAIEYKKEELEVRRDEIELRREELGLEEDEPEDEPPADGTPEPKQVAPTAAAPAQTKAAAS